MDALHASSAFLPVADARRPPIGRAILGAMLAAGQFELFAVGAKEIRPLGDHAPWMDDPYDVVTSFAMFFLPIVGAFAAVGWRSAGAASHCLGQDRVGFRAAVGVEHREVPAREPVGPRDVVVAVRRSGVEAGAAPQPLGELGGVMVGAGADEEYLAAFRRLHPRGRGGRQGGADERRLGEDVGLVARAGDHRREGARPRAIANS